MISRQLRKTFDREVGELGITGSQWALLAVVAGNPGATQKTIAEIMDMTEAAAGRLVDRMCKDGMVERRPKPDDRRAHCIHLTARAEPMLERMAELGAGHERWLLGGLDEQERMTLEALLDRVYRNVMA